VDALMAEHVQDLAAFLESAGHGTRAATSGWAIFHEGLQDGVETQIAVISTPGGPSEGQFGSDALRYEFPRAAIWVRAAREDVAGARTKAYAVYKALGTIQGETVNGTFYHFCRPLQPPFHLKDDGQGRPIFAFTVESEKEVAA
jgi:hypothetical protein